jgi:hypothetical protein
MSNRVKLYHEYDRSKKQLFREGMSERGITVRGVKTAVETAAVL